MLVYCSGICWWNSFNVLLKREESQFKGILWYFSSLWPLNTFTYSGFFVLVSNWKPVAAVIYPSLRQLRGESIELEDDDNRNQYREVLSGKRGENQRELSDEDLERDEECGICMENGAMMVLPNCGHSMCICCFHDWYHQFLFFAFSVILKIHGHCLMTCHCLMTYGYCSLRNAPSCLFCLIRNAFESQERTIRILPFLPWLPQES